jgi:hypothetical protein
MMICNQQNSKTIQSNRSIYEMYDRSSVVYMRYRTINFNKKIYISADMHEKLIAIGVNPRQHTIFDLFKIILFINIISQNRYTR